MFVRSEKNPILKPAAEISWRSRKVYNPTVIFEDGAYPHNQNGVGVYHLFFRAVGQDRRSRIGHARSNDGENFSIDVRPALEPGTLVDAAGVEDPRIVKIDERYHLTYTAYDNHTARLALAVSDDLESWEKIGPILSDWDVYSAGGFSVASDSVMGDEAADWNWSKGGAIFPEVINGEYLMIFGDRDLWLARSTDGLKWQAQETPWLVTRSDDFFDCLHVETGPPPIKTPQGWLVIYHGIDRQAVYRLGYLLLDLKDPTKVIRRSTRPIFEPRETYELNGLIDISAGSEAERRQKIRKSGEGLDKIAKITDNDIMTSRVVFCCGAVLSENVLKIYYGAGDAYVCTASVKLADLLAAV